MRFRYAPLKLTSATKHIRETFGETYIYMRQQEMTGGALYEEKRNSKQNYRIIPEAS